MAWDGRHMLKNNGTMLKNNEMTLGDDKNTNQIWKKQKLKGDIEGTYCEKTLVNARVSPPPTPSV